MKEQTNRSLSIYKPLTGLRFIAALMVFFTHLAPRNFTPFVNQFFLELQAGVPIFFVLSGFLLCHRYYDKFHVVKGAIRKYLWNRFVRIYPMYFLVGICNIILLKLDFITAILNITFLHGFFTEYVFKPLPHTWSLTVEVTFYLLLPLIFILFSKRIGIIIQTLIFVSIGLFLTFVFKNLNLEGFWFDVPYMMVLTFFGRCFEFLVGIQIGLFFKRNAAILMMPFNYTYWGIVMVALVIVLMTFIVDIFSYSGIIVHNFVLPLSIAVMLIGLIKEKTIVATILSSRLFILLGNSSYVFFLIHYGWWHKFLYNYVVQNLIWNLFLTTLFSILLYLFIEKPIEKKFKIKG